MSENKVIGSGAGAPAVSIIIPIFNQEEYIEGCLNSILSQTASNFEVVMVDDGSTDNTLSIIKRIVGDDDRFKLIVYESNKGTSQARKDAVLASSGKYIIFVDPDDTLSPNACQIAYDAIEKANVDMLQYGTNVINCGVNAGACERFATLCAPYGGVIRESTLFFACFEEELFNFNLWNKIYNGEMARRAFSCVKDGYYPKAQDMYAFALMAYYSQSYASIEDQLYNYYFGRGITGSRTIKLSRFSKITTQMHIIEQLFKFIDGERVDDAEHYCKVLKRRGQIFFNEVYANYKWLEDFENDQGEGMELILGGMTPVEPVSEFKSKFVYDKYIEALLSYVDDLYYKRGADFAQMAFDWLLDLLVRGVLPEGTYTGALYRTALRLVEVYKTEKKIIPVVFATNNGYAPYLGVTIQSLIEHASPDFVYDLYVFHTTLSDAHQQRLCSMSTENVFIRCVNVLPLVKSIRDYSHGHYSVEMYYRIVIPEVLSRYEKAVYLDCDLVLLSDVANLYSVDLNQNILAVVINDIQSDYMKSYLADTLHVTTDEYFNSGVLVINNKAFIEENVKSNALDYLNKIERLMCPDQDILNLACKDRVLYLGNEWNFQVGSGVYTLEDKYLGKYNIIHYTTGEKPWNTASLELGEYFWKYARLCPYYEDILVGFLEKTLNITATAGESMPREKRRNIINAGFKKKSIWTWPFRMAGKFFTSLRENGFGKTMHKVGVKLKYAFGRAFGRVDKYNNPIIKEGEQISPFERDAKRNFEYYDKVPVSKYALELQKWYNARTDSQMDISNPKTFNEKIQWLKINDAVIEKSHLSDKWLVKYYIGSVLGEEYLIKTLGVYDCFEDIDFDALPDKFVIKSTHGSGQVILVKDKALLDLDMVKKKTDRWISQTYAFNCGFEMHYYNMIPRIIIEEFVEGVGDDLYDYKLMCLNGKVKFIWVDTDRHTDHRRSLYDLDWNLLPIKYNYENSDREIPRPERLDELIMISEKLASEFACVRCDFYVLPDGSIKFGELTFTSCSGIDKWMPRSADVEFGKMLDLPKPKKFKKIKRDELLQMEQSFIHRYSEG